MEERAEDGAELGFVEAYGRYLEEKGQREEALPGLLERVLREVEREALEAGA